MKDNNKIYVVGEDGNYAGCFDSYNPLEDSSTIVSSGLTSVSITDRKVGVELPFTLEHVDGVFILLLLSFVVFAQIYHGGIGFLRENFHLLFSSNKLENREFKVSTSKEYVYSYFLVFQCILLLSIILYNTFSFYSPYSDTDKTPLLTILLFVFIFIAYILIKKTLYKIVGFLFDSKEEMQIWMKSYLIIFEILGVLLFFPTLVLIYANVGHLYLVLGMLSIFVLAHCIYFYRRVYYFISEKFNFLYLIAYLCTIEILPCVFLGLGLVKLYNFDVLNQLWLLK